MDVAHRILFVLTWLGSGYAQLAVVALGFWLVSPEAGRRLGLVLAASFGANTWLKGVVAEPRPFAAGGGAVSRWVRATATGSSWPSGHAQNAAAVWGYVALRARRRWVWAAVAALVTLVAASRVLLGVHFPHDVVAGVVVGLAVALAVGIALPRLPGWEPWLRRVAGVAALALWWAGGVYPEIGSLAAGCLLSQVRFRPPRTVGRILALVAGGTVATAAAYLSVVLVAAPLAGGGPGESGPAASGPAALAAILVAFEVWPRLARRWRVIETASMIAAERPAEPPREEVPGSGPAPAPVPAVPPPPPPVPPPAAPPGAEGAP